MTSENFPARLAQANLVTKTDFNNSNKTKHLLVENDLKKLETFASIYFLCESHFEDDSAQHWLVFQPIQRYFKTVSASDSNILSQNSKVLSDKSIKPPTISNKFLNPSLDFVGNKKRVKFNGDSG